MLPVIEIYAPPRQDRRSALMALLLAFLLAWSAGAQQDKRLAHLIKDQINTLKRLEVFSKKLDRLAVRLEKEGQNYASHLLKAAYARLIKSRVMENMEEAKRKLEGEQLFEAQKIQETALAELEQCLFILLDRQNLKQIEAELEKLRQNLKHLDTIREEEQHLYGETRRAGDPQRMDARQALKNRLEDLVDQQKKVRDETRGRTAGEQALWNRLRMALEDIREAQARLAGEMKQAAGQTLKEREKAQTRAAEALEHYAETLKKSAQAAGRDGGEQSEALRRGREAARRDAGKALENHARASSRTEQAEQAMDRARSAERKGDRALAAGKGARAEKAFEEGARAAMEAADLVKRAAVKAEARAALERLASRQKELAEALKQRKADLEKDGVPPDTRKEVQAAGEAMKKAGRSLEKAMKQAAGGKKDPEPGQESDTESGNGKEAAQHAGKASKALDRALNAMKAHDEARSARTRNNRDRLAKEQDALGEKARKLARDMEKNAQLEDAGTSGPDSADQSRKSRTGARAAGKAAEQMMQAGQDIRRDRMPRARDRQEKALDHLEEAVKELEARGPTTTNPEKRRQQLALWQEKIRQEVKKLRDKLASAGQRRADRNGGSQSKSLKRAERSMKRAQRELERGRMPQAEEREQESLAALNQAEREIKNRERNYIEMAQEEVIFRLGQMLRDVLKDQEDINHRSVVEGAKLKPGQKRMPRSLRKAFNRLGQRQRKARKVVDTMMAKLKEEKIEVFLFMLERINEDMGRLAENLSQRPPDLGRMTRLLQADVVRNLKSLLTTLEEEAGRRRKQREQDKKKKDGEKGQPRQQRLIPPTAEIIMLKNYEIQVRERTEKLMESLTRTSGGGEIPGHVQSLLTRLAHQQGQVREILKKFMKSLNIQ